MNLKHTMKHFREIYELPLVQDIYEQWVSNRISDSKGQFVFEFTMNDEKAQSKILDAINGVKPLENKELSFIHSEGYIIDDYERKIILIRGWGNLTGGGGHNLSSEDAANVQDTFAEFIAYQLNKRD